MKEKRIWFDRKRFTAIFLSVFLVIGQNAIILADQGISFAAEQQGLSVDEINTGLSNEEKPQVQDDIFAGEDNPVEESVQISQNEGNEGAEENIETSEKSEKTEEAIVSEDFLKEVSSNGEEEAVGDGNEAIGRNLTWEITGTAPNQILVINGTGAMYDYSTSDPVPWKASASAIRGISLPSGMTHIGNYAFDGFTGVSGDLELPASLESIGDYSFRNSSFNNNTLIIPSGVESIGQYAFYGCTGFSGDLTIPSSTKKIGDYAFYGCTGMNGGLTISSGVKSIGNSAFRECSGFTGDLVIPASVTSIGEYAFRGCSGMKDSLTIRSGLKTVKAGTFMGCGFTGDVTLSSVLETIESSAFEDCSGIGSVTIPPLVTSIGSGAFRNCTKLRDVYFEGNAPLTITASSGSYGSYSSQRQ